LKSISRALKKLKNNKAADADSFAAEQRKNGDPLLVNALEEVIQLVWSSDTQPESWTKGIFCPVFKKRR
jgi:hypothetical protein